MNEKISGWFTIAFIIAVIVAAFTVPKKEKLQQQLQATYGDTAHVNIEATKIKILVPMAIIYSYDITGPAKKIDLKVAGSKPVAVATFIKTGTDLGLFGRFWQWE